MTRPKPQLKLKEKAPQGDEEDPNYRRYNAMKSGAFAAISLDSLDGRTKLAKALRHIEADLVFALGGDENVTPQEKLILGEVLYKIVRLSLFKAATFQGKSTVANDQVYLAWSNSMRRDLESLGLQRRERQVLDALTYIQQQQEGRSEE